MNKKQLKKETAFLSCWPRCDQSKAGVSWSHTCPDGLPPVLRPNSLCRQHLLDILTPGYMPTEPPVRLLLKMGKQAYPWLSSSLPQKAALAGRPLTHHPWIGANQTHGSRATESLLSALRAPAPPCRARCTHLPLPKARNDHRRTALKTMWMGEDDPRIPRTFSVINVRLCSPPHPCLSGIRVVIFYFSKYICLENTSIE